MSAQYVFKPGVWPGNNARNSVADFPVRKFAFDRDKINLDFTHSYSGHLHYKDTLKNYNWTDGDSDQKFIMEISDHTYRPPDKEMGSIKDYLDVVINNPNAMIIIQNITEPCDNLQMERLGYLCDNMETKDFINRVLCLVPDQDSIYLYREHLARHHNFHDNLYIKDYAGHLVNYSALKATDDTLKTSYSQPRRVGLLNGQHKPFRLYICYKLWQAGLLDKMQVTYWNKFGYSNISDLPLSQLKQDLEYVETKCKSYTDIDQGFDDWLQLLPCTGGIPEGLYYHSEPFGKDFPWCLNESPIQVIPETLFDRHIFNNENIFKDWQESVFLTEKIYRALITGKAFLPMAQVGTLDKLHNMGFKTFEKWWPEYDLELVTETAITTSDVKRRPVNGMYQRYENMVNIVSDIYNKSDAEFQTMMTEMKPTLLHNQNRMQELIDHQERNRKEVFLNIHNWLNNNE